MTQISAGSSTQLFIAPLTNRVNAYVLDFIILQVLTVGIATLTALTLSFTLAFAATSAVALLWPMVWLRAASATPGKLLTRLLVQPAHGPGRLSWSAIVSRTVVEQLAAWVISIALAVGLVAESRADGLLTLPLVWVLVDCLWATTNDTKQALHDKAARTVVVQRVTWPTPVTPPRPDEARERP